MTSTDTQEQFQHRVQPWLMACFGAMIAGDREERNHRFIEEALELVQSLGCTAHEAHQLVDYVYGRDIGEPAQEVGGVMVTLAALCLANGLDMHANGETELSRIWTKVEAIRAKQAAKPKHSPLPMSTPPTPATEEREAVAQWCSGCHEVRSVDCYRAGCPKSDTERRAAEILAAEANERARALGQSDWLDIETAPRDGRVVLCIGHNNIHHVEPMMYYAADDGMDNGCWGWLEGDTPRKQPTHWMLLPAPPNL